MMESTFDGKIQAFCIMLSMERPGWLIFFLVGLIASI